jgi:hypothetical protein
LLTGLRSALQTMSDGGRAQAPGHASGKMGIW